MSKDGWIGSEQPEKNESREEQRRRMPEFMMAVMLLIAVFLVSRQAGLMVSGQAVAVGARRPVVVLDSGKGDQSADRTSPENLSGGFGCNGGHDQGG